MKQRTSLCCAALSPSPRHRFTRVTLNAGARTCCERWRHQLMGAQALVLDCNRRYVPVIWRNSVSYVGPYRIGSGSLVALRARRNAAGTIARQLLCTRMALAGVVQLLGLQSATISQRAVLLGRLCADFNTGQSRRGRSTVVPQDWPQNFVLTLDRDHASRSPA